MRQRRHVAKNGPEGLKGPLAKTIVSAKKRRIRKRKENQSMQVKDSTVCMTTIVHWCGSSFKSLLEASFLYPAPSAPLLPPPSAKMPPRIEFHGRRAGDTVYRQGKKAASKTRLVVPSK